LALSDGAVVGATSRDALLVGEGIAPEHLRVSVRSDGCYLEDLGTTEGTFVGGVRALRIGVLHGDVVRLGRQLAVFVEHDLTSYAGPIDQTGPLLHGPKQRADWAMPVLDLVRAGSSVCIEGGPGTGKRALAIAAVTGHDSHGPVMIVDAAKDGIPRLFTPEGGAAPGNGPVTWLVLGADRLARARQVEITHAAGESSGATIIATTRVPLDQAVKDGLVSAWFASLFAGKRVTIPGLEGRREDIPAIVRNIAERRRIEQDRLSPELLEALVRAGWPGGVPQLETTLVAAVAATSVGPLQLAPIAERLARPSSLVPSLPPASDPSLARARLEDALARANGSVASAARSLGMSRQAIYREAERLGLNIAHRKTPRS
ncbi:MAG: FHA domain-containing protein, partial [Minicystis sp.]